VPSHVLVAAVACLISRNRLDASETESPLCALPDCDNASMAEHYVDTLTVRLQGHDEQMDLAEGMALTVSPRGPVDLDKLADEIRADLAGRPWRIRQTYQETAWGASSAGAILLIDVPSVMTGFASMTVLWDRVSRRVLNRGQPSALTGEEAARDARTWIAECQNVAADEVRITGLDPLADGHRVKLVTPSGSYEVEIGGNGAMRMHRS
jgi:hypothetical protein